MCLPWRGWLSRYLVVYVSEGCQPQNRLYYLDLDLVPRAESGALDFSKSDFFKGVLAGNAIMQQHPA